MSQTFHLPDLGEGVHEGQILRILVPAGSPVELDQPLMEVETDKAAVEIPSPFTGVVDTWHVREQQVVNVGDAMVTVRATDEAATTAAAETATPAAAANAATPPAAHAAASGGGATTMTAPADATTPPRRRPASPAVRSLARRLGVDLEAVDGSGPGGRILRRDVEAAAAVPATDTVPAASVTPAAPPAVRPTSPPAHTAIAVLPTPVSTPVPSAAPAPVPAAAPAAAAPAAASRGVHTPVPDAALVPAHAEPGHDERGAYFAATISRTRLAIARTMTEAVQTIPHVTDCDDADVTELLAFRRAHNQSMPADRGVGVLSFVIRAVARALQSFPIFNASWDEDAQQVLYRREIHIAVGMQTPRGLVAPVIRDADRLSVSGIEATLAALTEKCRAGRFEPADAHGATYTVSNAGAMGGSRYATPIITPPQVAVLAVGRTREMPWVVDGEVKARSIMPLSHSMDHRLIDGAVEIAFMRHVIADLEHPGRMLV
ncbi:MAG: dihydrolipoamide acetyltransferase family protein [Planctomycetota bacterium]|jgi:pyruvate dehydrogenase E2 component (dihydrolipoamide acetyltransferase)